MFTKIIEPRFNETDAVGHINNNVYSIWFDSARTPIFEIFNWSAKDRDFKLIMAHHSIDFLNEVFYGFDVEIKTSIEKVGNTSIHLKQEIYQKDVLCTQSKSILVHYDFINKGKKLIPQSIKKDLQID